MQRERAFSLNIIHILRITYSNPTIAVSGMHHHHPLPSPNLQADAKKKTFTKNIKKNFTRFFEVSVKIMKFFGEKIL